MSILADWKELPPEQDPTATPVSGARSDMEAELLAAAADEMAAERGAPVPKPAALNLADIGSDALALLVDAQAEITSTVGQIEKDLLEQGKHMGMQPPPRQLRPLSHSRPSLTPVASRSSLVIKTDRLPLPPLSGDVLPPSRPKLRRSDSSRSTSSVGSSGSRGSRAESFKRHARKILGKPADGPLTEAEVKEAEQRLAKAKQSEQKTTGPCAAGSLGVPPPSFVSASKKKKKPEDDELLTIHVGNGFDSVQAMLGSSFAELCDAHEAFRRWKTCAEYIGNGALVPKFDMDAYERTNGHTWRREEQSLTLLDKRIKRGFTEASLKTKDKLGSASKRQEIQFQQQAKDDAGADGTLTKRRPTLAERLSFRGVDARTPQERSDDLLPPRFRTGWLARHMSRSRFARRMVRAAPWVLALGGALAMEYLLFLITVDLFAGQPEEALPWLASVGIGVTYGWLVHEPGLFMLTCIARAVTSLATRARHGAQRRRERPSRARIGATHKSAQQPQQQYGIHLAYRDS